MWSKTFAVNKTEEGEPPSKKLITDGDLLIKELVKKQTNTNISLNEQLNVKNDFQKTAEFAPITNYTAGTSSLREFNSVFKQAEEMERLKNVGFAKDEIDLYFDSKLGFEYLKNKYKNKNTDALQQKLEEIIRRIKNCDGNNEEDRTTEFKDTLETTLMLSAKPDSTETKLLKFAIENKKNSIEKLPHPMDKLKLLENELFAKNSSELNIKKIRKKARNLQNKIDALGENVEVVAPPKPRESYSQAKCSKWDLKNEMETRTKKTYTCKPQTLYTIKNGQIVKLDEIETTTTTKISIDEIRKTTRFKNYDPGHFSSILYLKNLSDKVTEQDLANVFKLGELEIKLMKGKMRRQAFIYFDCTEDAIDFFEKHNGYILKGKPIVIEFGKSKS